MDSTEAETLFNAYTVEQTAPVNLDDEEARRLGLTRCYRGPAIVCERHENVHVNARGEMFQDGRILPASYALGNPVERRGADRLARAAERAMADAAELDAERLVVSDRWSANYYHWLCDTLPRLEAWLARHAGGNLLLPAALCDRTYVRDSLAAYPGIAVDRTAALHPNLHVRALTIVSHAADSGFHHPLLTRRVAARLGRLPGARGKPGQRRIYATRRRARMRRIANEEAIAPMLYRHGFEMVEFDEMRLVDQITLMAETQILAGPHGAGLANMMFMAPGGAVLEMRQLEGPPIGYISLAGVFGHGHFCLPSLPVNGGVHYHGADMIADAGRLEAVLDAMEGWLAGNEKGPAA